MRGSITNASGRDVKETVQLYIEAPYYKDGSKIEKAAKVLVDFGKYAVAAGQTVDMAAAKLAKDLLSWQIQ